MAAKRKCGSAPLADARWVRRSVKTIALIAFAGYVVWNAAWLLHGRIPPSIFFYCTGLPCPTTGMTRSMIALCRGNVRDFFLFNPFTLIYLALIGGSVLFVLQRYRRQQPIVLPSFMAWAWLAALGLGWLAKFAIGNRYW